MSVFNNYALYYDLLYKDKNYQGEADYVYNLLKQHTTKLETVLELGCGTGKHAELLAKKGLNIVGIDFSEFMLEEANKRKSSLPDDIANKLTFINGNVCNIRLDKKFDAIISLFHVASYQTTNEALENYFKTATEHLNTGGIFLFDCWYGPAVLTYRPATRIKRLENDNIKVLRIAEPVIHENENTVDVNYQVIIEYKANGKTEEFSETHKMRYLFKPEIELLMDKCGFKMIKTEEWLTGKEIGFDIWFGCFILYKE